MQKLDIKTVAAGTISDFAARAFELLCGCSIMVECKELVIFSAR